MSKKKETFDPSKYSGAGLETTEGLSNTIPFIQIIQNGSPEIKKSHDQHQARRIEGAEEGDLVFLPEKILFKGDEGVEVIPLAFRSLYTEWKPKSQGGGFIGTHALDVTSKSGYVREGNKEFLNGNELILTIYAAVHFIHEGERRPAVLSFTSTQLKKARNWSKMITSFRYKNAPKVPPPIFACSYRITTKMEKNDQGEWFGWHIETERVIEDNDLLEESFEAVQAAQSELPSPSAPRALGSGEEEEEAF